MRKSRLTLTAGLVAIDAQPVEVAVEFSDPGTADTHTTAIGWGDGITDTLDSSSPVIAHTPMPSLASTR